MRTRLNAPSGYPIPRLLLFYDVCSNVILTPLTDITMIRLSLAQLKEVSPSFNEA